MVFINTWTVLAFLAWLLCVASVFVYANFRGWLESPVLAALAKARLYLLLRWCRTLALLCASVSVIAFLYYETDVFFKEPPVFEFTLTPEQYAAELAHRSRIIADKMKYATADQRKILGWQKSYFDEKLADPGKAYAEHAAALVAYERNLRAMLRSRLAPSDLLKKAMRAMAEGDLMEADIFLEAIENTAHLNVKAAGWVSWARGYLAEQAADFAGAYKHYSRAAQFMPHNPDLEVYTGWLAFNMGDYKNSMTHYEAALANRMRRYGEHDPVVAADLRNLGAVAAYLEDYREMYEYYERALLIDLQAYGESRPEVAVDRSNVGRALSYMKEYGKAIPHFEQALALNLKHYGKDAPAILDDYERLGDAWGELADYGKSAMYYKLALNSALKIRGAGHLDVARYQNQLGWLQSKLGDYKNAITYYEQALLAYRKHYPEDEPKVIEIKSNLRNLRKFCEKAGCLPL